MIFWRGACICLKFCKEQKQFTLRHGKLRTYRIFLRGNSVVSFDQNNLHAELLSDVVADGREAELSVRVGPTVFLPEELSKGSHRHVRMRSEVILCIVENRFGADQHYRFACIPRPLNFIKTIEYLKNFDWETSVCHSKSTGHLESYFKYEFSVLAYFYNVQTMRLAMSVQIRFLKR